MWEYKTIILMTYELGEMDQALNRWGSEGWELVSVAEIHDTPLAFLKRRMEAS